MLDSALHLWPHILVGLHIIIACSASAHVVLVKRDPRAAIGWVGVIWLAPLLGSFLYFVLGVNRIRRRARSRRPTTRVSDAAVNLVATGIRTADTAPPPGVAHLQALFRLSSEVTRQPLLPGNLVTPLPSGEDAYAAMVGAIDRAEQTVGLSTYIFDNDRAGAMFIDALARAAGRGVEVRVMVDDVGSRYSWPSTVRALRRSGVPVAKFMPTTLPWRYRYSNLRNHRKILVADGTVGFTGGMNIRAGALADAKSRHRLIDLHFQLQGPVVAHLQDVFADDWSYCTGEVLEGERWFPANPETGPVWARGIVDGPDGNFDKLRMALLGAVSCAASSLVVISPYFLPDDALLTALDVAAMRGVAVDIVLPSKNNLSLVAWASTTLWPSLLEHGCRIWLSSGPFDHTKLMLVDDVWTLLGSANWDPRSLQLNFEFNVECYDPELAGSLRKLAAAKIARAHAVSLQELHERPMTVRLRDGVARLLTPYL
ncbi:MAG: cardiolipin synthase [Acidobacteria bacterium]|nr:cardiolipin synthase [Acidobacteriota bacterium]